MAVYYASKAFVLSFSEALWEEARGTGVSGEMPLSGNDQQRFRERAGTDATRLSRIATSMSSMGVAVSAITRQRQPARRHPRHAQSHRRRLVAFAPAALSSKLFIACNHRPESDLENQTSPVFPAIL